jgi:hypothetical protein
MKQEVVNVADERRFRELDKKFQLKGAHERDITGITRLLYVVLHIGSAIGAIWSIYSMSFDTKLEKLMYLVVFGALMVINEVLKAKKMEYFAILKIISNDVDEDLQVREKAEDETPKAFLLVLVFWLVSVCAIGYTGYTQGAAKVTNKFTALNYDETLRKQAETAILSLQNAVTSGGYSAKMLAKFTDEKNLAVGTWKTHKESIDRENRQRKSSNEDEAVVMGLIYLLIAIAYEFVLFLARKWHESEQYEVLKSKKKQRKQTSNSEKQARNTEKQAVTAEKETVYISQTDLDMLLQQNRVFQKAISDRDKTISLLEETVKGK